MKKCGIIGCAILTVLCLCFAVFGGSALAEIGLGGKIETNFLGTIGPDGDVTTIWQEHLNLDFLLPDLGTTSARFEIDMYYEPQSAKGIPSFSGDVSKLYVKQRFSKWHLTLGRQPITWSFGSLVNPVDFSVNTDLLQMGGQGMSENAAVVYLPLGWATNVSVVAAWPELGQGTKFGIRGRTNLAGFDLTANYLREPERIVAWEGMQFTLPESQRMAFTAKGDLGPVGVYGTAGYNFQDVISDGKIVYLLGADYSFNFENGSKLVMQAEYLRDESGVIQSAQTGPNLLLGMLSYEIDEFAGLSMLAGFNPQDQSVIIAPIYKNQIGSGLDVNLSGVLFIGSETSQFGPKTVMGVMLPRAMVQIGVGYPF